MDIEKLDEKNYISPHKKALLDFWENQDFKIYIITLKDTARRNPKKNDVKFIRVKSIKDNAAVQFKAAKVAIRESVTFNKKAGVTYSARLAHPVSDLGCTWSGEGINPLEIDWDKYA